MAPEAALYNAEAVTDRARTDSDDVVLTPEAIEAFLTECRSLGYPAETLKRYRNAMDRAYNKLPEGKRIARGTLSRLKDKLLEEGFSPNTVNSTLSVCNTWLTYIDHRELQTTERLDLSDRYRPELTRNEYLRLLKTAKAQGNEKKYLLTKVFALTGVSAQKLEPVTMEAVRDNTLGMPEFLVKELTGYAKRNSIKEGPLFITRDGKPLARTNVPRVLQCRTEQSGIPEEKITAKNLGRLRDSLRESLRTNLTLLVEQNMDRQMEEEEKVIGWSR